MSDEKTIDLGKSITDMSMRVLRVMLDSTTENPDLDWLHAVSAAALACRSLAASVVSSNPTLSVKDANEVVLRVFGGVLSAPADVVGVMVADEEGNVSTDDIPSHKH